MNSVECLDLSQENGTWQPVASLTYRRGKKRLIMKERFDQISLSLPRPRLALPGVCVHQSKDFPWHRTFVDPSVLFIAPVRFDLRLWWIRWIVAFSLN